MSIVEVKVPELSESVSEASLIEWKKKVGEPVKADEILIEIETDKIVLEIPAPADGGFPTTEAAERISGGSSNNRLAFPLLLVPIFPSPFHFDSLSSSIPGFHGKYVPAERNRILADV